MRPSSGPLVPPAVACVPGPNPAGKVPSCGEGNWRPDGFFRLLAVDAVDPAPLIYVVDVGTGTVFGPYPSGTAIKYTQAPGGKPRASSIGGPGSAVAWHITGKGDASVYAVDASGNRSDAVACLVPPKGPPGSGGDDDGGKGDDDGHGRKGDDDGHGHKDRRGHGDGRDDDGPGHR